MEKSSLRTVHIDDEEKNAQYKYGTNYVRTTKYTAWTLMPLFLCDQFSKASNLLFLSIALVQTIKDISPVSSYTTTIPLAAVLLFSLLREVFEDHLRRRVDKFFNESVTTILQDGALQTCRWRDVKVGHVVKVERNRQLPADLVLLESSEPQNIAYLETANIDGESNLKVRFAPECTGGTRDFHGTITCEPPNDQIYRFEGSLKLATDERLALDSNSFLPRGCVLRNTDWVLGAVVYTGADTKIMKNNTSTPLKRTKMERKTNRQIFGQIMVLLAICTGSACGFWYYDQFVMEKHAYLYWKPSHGTESVMLIIESIMAFMILYNTIVPISLSVTLESVRLILSRLVENDLEIYDDETDTPATARSSNLMEELGQVEYILTDKTGTLTSNDMVLKHLMINGQSYRNCCEPLSELQTLLELKAPGSKDIHHFLMMLSICHTVMIDKSEDAAKGPLPPYLASSPDELAIVRAASKLGYVFSQRVGSTLRISVFGKEIEAEIRAVVEFTSTRKRMSTLVRLSDGKIFLFCKGADTVITERLSPENNDSKLVEKSMHSLEGFAQEGLRTLCFAYRQISETECAAWMKQWSDALNNVSDRQNAIDKASDALERDLIFLGATGVEDRLQVGVPSTVACLLKANIRIWMLTGDRLETAVSTGFLCGLITECTAQLHLIEREDQAAMAKTLATILERIRNAPVRANFALIASGAVLERLFSSQASESLLDTFVAIVSACRTVICCRLSPLQKSQITLLLKERMNKVTLAIGDGGNDVNMIQAANVGIGISGKEGLQAARAADFSIAQFRFLKRLLLVHGAWSLHRLSRVIQYCIFKNVVLYFGQLWYAFFSMFSGQTLFEDWMLVNYNLIFTQWPPTIIGLTDQFVAASDLVENPQLYEFGQKGKFNDNKTFWTSVLGALLQSLLVFATVYFIFQDDMTFANGKTWNHWLLGTIAYAIVLLAVSLKSALFTNYFTRVMAAGIMIGVMLWLLLCPVNEMMHHSMGTFSSLSGSASELFRSPVFWALILFVPVLVTARDFLWKFYRRQFRPHSYHIIQELRLQKAEPATERKLSEKPFKRNTVFIGGSPKAVVNRGFTFSQSRRQSMILEAYGQSPTISTHSVAFSEPTKKKIQSKVGNL